MASIKADFYIQSVHPFFSPIRISLEVLYSFFFSSVWHTFIMAASGVVSVIHIQAKVIPIFFELLRKGPGSGLRVLALGAWQ